jgi:hypothetical protein
MARKAAAEGGVIEADQPMLAPVTIAPDQPAGPVNRVKIKLTALKVQTSEGRMLQYWVAYLPEPEANRLIAEGKAELCR